MTDFILNILLGIFLGWALTQIIGGYLRAKLLLEIHEKIKEAAEEETKERWIMVNVEQHDGIFYLYEKNTDQFIAQGKTMEELSQRCRELFKDHTVIADENDLKSFGLTD